MEFCCLHTVEHQYIVSVSCRHVVASASAKSSHAVPCRFCILRAGAPPAWQLQCPGQAPAGVAARNRWGERISGGAQLQRAARSRPVAGRRGAPAAVAAASGVPDSGGFLSLQRDACPTRPVGICRCIQDFPTHHLCLPAAQPSMATALRLDIQTLGRVATTRTIFKDNAIVTASSMKPCC